MRIVFRAPMIRARASKAVIVLAACVLTTTNTLFAGSPVERLEQPKAVAPQSEFPFVSGAREIELGLGAFLSVGTKDTSKRPDTSFGLAQFNHGWMLSDVRGDGLFRGNYELLAGLFGGGILDGPGDGLAGAELLLRYNFVQPDARLVPFFQIGFGGVYSDAAKDDRTQRLIGSDWSFDLEGAIGLRWMFSSRCALSLKAEYRHFSNVGLADRNMGLNAVGGVLAVSWFY